MATAYVKISVYVPSEPVTRRRDGKHFAQPAAAVREVVGGLSPLGAAVMGPYDNVSFTIKGAGHFRPIPTQANPSSGREGEHYFADGEVISFVAPRKNVHRIVSAIAENHPYETPHIEVIAIVRHAFDGLPP